MFGGEASPPPPSRLNPAASALSRLCVGPSEGIGTLEGLQQNAKCGGRASFLLADRMFTCHGEVADVKACGGSFRSSGIHFYLSLYASSTDTGSNSLLLPEVVNSQWGFAGTSVWKPVTLRNANTPADSRCAGKICYSPGDFLGVTVYHQRGEGTGYVRCT